VLSHNALAIQQSSNNQTYQPVNLFPMTYQSGPDMYSTSLVQIMVPFMVAPGHVVYYPCLMVSASHTAAPQLQGVPFQHPVLPQPQGVRFQHPVVPQPQIMSLQQTIAPPSQSMPLLPMPTGNLAQPKANITIIEEQKERQRQKHKRQHAPKSAKSFLKETLTDKIRKSDVYREHIKAEVGQNGAHFPAQPGNPRQISSSSGDYSQYPVLAKINAFLRNNNCLETTHIGHCNGLTILWLTMMSWKLEYLFYKMIKEIANCPDDQLQSIHKTIISFFDWIDIGQNPGHYSGNKYNQVDIDKIIGTIDGMNFFKKHYSLDEAANVVKKCVTKNTIVVLAGHDIDRNGKTRNIGHAIGLFYRASEGYSVFDPDHENGKPRVFASAHDAANEANLRIFPNASACGVRKFTWQVAVAKRPAPLPNESQIQNTRLVA
jgi:hypothetical protein